MKTRVIDELTLETRRRGGLKGGREREVRVGRRGEPTTKTLCALALFPSDAPRAISLDLTMRGSFHSAYSPSWTQIRQLLFPFALHMKVASGVILANRAHCTCKPAPITALCFVQPSCNSHSSSIGPGLIFKYTKYLEVYISVTGL